jgi:indolepyruvate ferredoxin oxidoreductase beta subunit
MRNMKTTNVIISGVGGQGSLLASKLLGRLLVDEGYDVKVSEVHGMSQRGGSVITYVKFGDKVYSPIICENEADFIVSFEKIEAVRWASCLKEGGKIIVNNQEIDPMPVITGAAEYPHDALEKLEELAGGMKGDKCCIACSKCTELMRAGSTPGCAIRDPLYTAIYKEIQK